MPKPEISPYQRLETGSRPHAENQVRGRPSRRYAAPMPLNAEWHRANPMPKNPTEDQRIAWHLAHVAHCGCRAIPDRLAERMRERGIAMPPPVKAQG